MRLVALATRPFSERMSLVNSDWRRQRPAVILRLPCRPFANVMPNDEDRRIEHSDDDIIPGNGFDTIA